VRLGRDFYVGGYKSWGENPPGKNLVISCPTEEYPDEPFVINLWIDFMSADLEGPLKANQVVTVNAGEATLRSALDPIDFYEE
jgi:hypothetical protein